MIKRLERAKRSNTYHREADIRHVELPRFVTIRPPKHVVDRVELSRWYRIFLGYRPADFMGRPSVRTHRDTLLLRLKGLGRLEQE